MKTFISVTRGSRAGKQFIVVPIYCTIYYIYCKVKNSVHLFIVERFITILSWEVGYPNNLVQLAMLRLIGT